MPGLLDDLIPAAPATGAPPSADPAAANAFADLIPPRGYRLVPVDGDPYAAFPDAPPASPPTGSGPRFVPVDHDPFADFPDAPAPGAAQPASMSPADDSGDPWWKRAGHYANDMVRATANAVPIVGAWADKADAATDAALSGKSYDQAMAGQQVEDAPFGDAHPYSKVPADLAGAGGGTMAMLPAAGFGLGPSTMAALGVDSGQAWDPTLASLSSCPAVASAMGDAATSAANRGAPWPTITLDAAGQPVGSDVALAAHEAAQRPAITSALANLLVVDLSTGPLAAEDAIKIGTACAMTPGEVRARLVMLESMRLVAGRRDNDASSTAPRRVFVITGEAGGKLGSATRGRRHRMQHQPHAIRFA